MSSFSDEICSGLITAINKHHWNSKNFCTHDNCRVRNSKNVHWRARGDRQVIIFTNG